MKTRVFIYVLATVGVLFSQMQPMQAKDVFYYNGDEKIFLKERVDQIFLKLDLEVATKEKLKDLKSDIESYELVTDIDIDEKVISPFVIIETKNGADIPLTLYENCKANEMVLSATNVLEYNGLFGLTDEFAVKLKPSSSYKQLEELALQNNCVIVKEHWVFVNHYVLSVSKTSELNSLQTANLFYETGLFEFSEPDAVIFNAFHSSDPYFSDQWGLKNTGQYSGTAGVDIKIESAWTVTEGNPNIKIVVMDDGTELDHPDLANNLLPGYDSSGNFSEGAPVYSFDIHGTACSGIIGAIKDNGIGISGVATDCKIIPIHTSNRHNQLPYSYLIEAFEWVYQNGNADVISNSWTATHPNTFLTNIIDTVATHGRNGLGCVLVFATGNENSSAVSYPASLSNVIAVGAISPCGERKSPSSCDTETSWGSNYGQALNIVAPGVLVSTTDRQGTNGYNPYEPVHPDDGGTILTSDYSIGIYALGNNETGSYNTAIGYVATFNRTDLINTTAIGHNAQPTSSHQAKIGNSLVTGIGGYASWTNFSDKRAKKNIRTDVPGLAFINGLQPVTYNLDLDAIDGLLKIDKTKGRDEKELPQELIEINKKAREAKEKVIQTGFIAQDVEKTAQSIGYDFSGVDVDETGIYGLRYAEFVVPLVKAVQELSEQNERLQAQINELQEKDMQRSETAGESATGLQDVTNSSASLQQNAPNPFSQNTQIRFYLPQSIKTASLNIYNLQGKQMKQITITQRGEGSQLIAGSEFAAGIYLYALIADGKKIDTKEMILTE